MSVHQLIRPMPDTGGMVLTLDLYCRISQDYDGTLRSVDDQEAWGREWCEQHGFRVGRVFRDHALSGWNPKVVRPEWNELMARLRSGEAHGVWVRDLGRFTRKMREALDLRDVADAGRVVASGKSGQYDLRTAEGLDRFLSEATRMEVESKQISDRTTNGKAMKAKQRGRSNASHRGFGRPGFLPNPEGWQVGDPRTEVDPEQLDREVQAVRAAALLLLGGGTVNEVVTGWNDAGLTTVNGNRWDNTTVRQVLLAPSTAGLVSYKGEVVEGKTLPGEPVLDRETWDRLRLLFSGRKRGRPAVAYLLSGIARCGSCGGPLYGRPRVSRPDYPLTGDERLDADRQKREYWCQPRSKEQTGCGKVAMDQRQADAQVEFLVVERLGDPRHASRVARVRAKVGTQRAALQGQLADLNAECDAVADRLGDPGWTVARVNKGLAKYGAMIAEVEAKLDALGAPEFDGEDTTAAAAADAQAAWDAASHDRRRRMVRQAFPEGLAILPAPAGARGRGAKGVARIAPLPLAQEASQTA